MEGREARDFHHSIYELSKKELQDLCRTYGLSPYKTKPHLVNSLISYFKVVNTNLSEGYGIRNSAQISSNRRGTAGPGYVRKRGKGDFKHKADIPHIISFEKSNHPFVREIEVSDMSQSQPRGSDSLTKNLVASAVKPIPVPSFEFSVRSEEGINLVVDLNSSPSEWPNRLQNGICLCHSFCQGKLQSFCEEHRCLENGDKQNNTSFTVSGDLDGKMKSDHECKGSLPNTLQGKNADSVFLHPAEDNGFVELSKTNAVDRQNGGAVFLLPAADNGSMGFSKTKPCTLAMDMPRKENKEFPLFCGLSSDHQIVSDPTASSLMDGEAGITDLNDLHAHKGKKDLCSKSNLLVDVPTNALRDQNMQLTEKCASINTGNACSIRSPGLASPVSPIIGPTKIQSSEMTCQEQVGLVSPCLSNHDKNIVDAVPAVKSRVDGLANFSDVDHNNYERIGSVNQKEDQDKLGGKSEVFASDQGCKRKRLDIESEKDRGNPDSRTLRSGKHPHGQFLRRRSKRLVSK